MTNGRDRVGRLILLVLLPIATAHAAAPPAATPMEGTVLDPAGHPVVGARVEVSAWGSDGVETREKTATDAQGRFAASLAEPWSLLVIADGWAPWFREWPERNQRVVLERGAPISGVVRNQGGGSISGAQLRLRPLSHERIQTAREVVLLEASTDPHGSFGPLRLSPGSYQMEVHADGSAPAFVGLHVPESGVSDLVVALESGRSLRLVVRDDTGAALPHANVGVSCGNWRASGVADTEGIATIQDAPSCGCYVVEVDHERTVFGARDDRAIAACEGADCSAMVTVPRGARATGRVRSTAGTPLAKIVVSWETIGARGRTTTREDGTFTLEGVPLGRIWLRARGDGYAETSIPELSIPAEGAAGIEIRLAEGQAVSGIAVDETGAPIAGAEITASSYGPVVSAITDARGAFSVKGLGPGRVSVDARAEGYLEAELDDAPARGVRLVLKRAAVIRGTVHDAAGRPLRGAWVEVWEVLSGGGLGHTFESTVTASAGTLDDGNFTIPYLVPGRYSLRIQARGFGPVVIPEIAAIAGDGNPPLSIRLPTGRVLSGRIVDDRGRPVAGGRVTAVIAGEPGDGELFCGTMIRWGPSVGDAGDAVSGKDGSFRMAGMPEGWVTLRVDHPAFAPQNVQGVPADGNGVEIVMGHPATIFGRVVGAGKPVGGATIKVQGAEAVADEEGLFTLSGVAPGALELLACAPFDPDRPYVPEEREILLATAGAESTVAIELSSGVDVRGRVWLGPAPAAGALVQLRPSGNVREATTDAEGRFEISHVAAGPAKARCFVRTPDGAYRSRSFDLTIGDEGSTSVDLRLPDPGASIHLRIVDADTREPLPEGYVATDSLHASGSPEKDGSWSWDDVPAGRHELLVRAAGHSPERRTLELAENERVDLIVPLAKGPEDVALHGVVRLPDGTPAFRASVVVLGLASGWARTDARGRYEVSIDAGERPTVAAYLEGYGIGMRSVDATAEGPVDVSLGAPSFLAITALDRGKPVQGAQVELMGPPWVGAFQELEARLTDSQGMAFFPGVASGELTVCVRIGGREVRRTVTLSEGEQRRLTVDCADLGDRL